MPVRIFPEQSMNTIGSTTPQSIRECSESSKIQKPGEKNVRTFEETLKGFINDVNELQQDAGKSVEKLLTGEIKDVHDVMVAVEKAGTSFELMMEIRNKMIDAYREVIRM